MTTPFTEDHITALKNHTGAITEDNIHKALGLSYQQFLHTFENTPIPYIYHRRNTKTGDQRTGWHDAFATIGNMWGRLGGINDILRREALREYLTSRAKSLLLSESLGGLQYDLTPLALQAAKGHILNSPSMFYRSAFSMVTSFPNDSDATELVVAALTTLQGVAGNEPFSFDDLLKDWENLSLKLVAGLSDVFDEKDAARWLNDVAAAEETSVVAVRELLVCEAFTALAWEIAELGLGTMELGPWDVTFTLPAQAAV